MSRVHIVWFRRDLRLHDNAALKAACTAATNDGGSVLALYMIEPDYWALPQSSHRQFQFIHDSLQDLDQALQARGTCLHVLSGEAVKILSGLHKSYGLASLHCEPDVPLAWTAKRTSAVEKWCRDTGVAYREQPHGEAHAWRSYAEAQQIKAPTQISALAVQNTVWPAAPAFAPADNLCPDQQEGGRRAGGALLRALGNIGGASDLSHLSGRDAAQRLFTQLSAHLVYGTVSLREAWQATAAAGARYKRSGQAEIADACRRFQAYLEWHFQRKGRRADPVNEPDQTVSQAQRLEAWQSGRTGYPLIDASLRALEHTGCLSWRLRALVLNFAARMLDTGWAQPAEYLASRLTDYDPGLHNAFIQALSQDTQPQDHMKQATRLDPDGMFVREWLPELAAMPTAYIHAPWEASAHVLIEAGLTLGVSYPSRIFRPKPRQRSYEPRRPADTSDVFWRRSGARPSAVFPYRQRHPENATPWTKPKQLSLDLSDRGATPDPELFD